MDEESDGYGNEGEERKTRSFAGAGAKTMEDVESGVQILRTEENPEEAYAVEGENPCKGSIDDGKVRSIEETAERRSEML